MHMFRLLIPKTQFCSKVSLHSSHETTGCAAVLDLQCKKSWLNVDTSSFQMRMRKAELARWNKLPKVTERGFSSHSHCSMNRSQLLSHIICTRLTLAKEAWSPRRWYPMSCGHASAPITSVSAIWDYSSHMQAAGWSPQRQLAPLLTSLWPGNVLNIIWYRIWCLIWWLVRPSGT